jgi:hypothetical protein
VVVLAVHDWFVSDHRLTVFGEGVLLLGFSLSEEDLVTGVLLPSLILAEGRLYLSSRRMRQIPETRATNLSWQKERCEEDAEGGLLQGLGQSVEGEDLVKGVLLQRLTLDEERLYPGLITKGVLLM